MNPPDTRWIAFAGHQRIANGAPRELAAAVNAHAEAHPDAPVLVFDEQSSQPIDVDWQGPLAAVLKRLPLPHVPAEPSPGAAADAAPRGPGRPRLGVVAREVTLLPRHWDWLSAQPGGASVALRKLVERALRDSVPADRRRAALESAYRFMHALAGDAAGFEEASRALFAGDFDRLQIETSGWPMDVQSHLAQLVGRAAECFANPAEPATAPEAPARAS